MSNISVLFEGGSEKTQRKKKVTFYVICATLALMLSLLLVLGVYGIASSLWANAKANQKISIGTTKTVTLSSEDIYSGDLLLLDATHPLAEPAQVVLMSTNRPKTETGSSIYSLLGTTSLSLRADVLKQFNAMAEDFYKQTKDDNLLVYNAYDATKSSQAAIYESGTALSLGYYGAPVDEEYPKNDSIYGVEVYSWLYDNCYKYGFVVLNSEAETDNDGNSLGSSVFRYVGIPHATAIAEKKLSFERYLEYLKENTSARAPLSIGTSTSQYAVYYISARGTHTVPSKYEYTVSGNNADGYIVTVKIPRK